MDAGLEGGLSFGERDGSDGAFVGLVPGLSRRQLVQPCEVLPFRPSLQLCPSLPLRQFESSPRQDTIAFGVFTFLLFGIDKVS